MENDGSSRKLSNGLLALLLAGNVGQGVVNFDGRSAVADHKDGLQVCIETLTKVAEAQTKRAEALYAMCELLTESHEHDQYRRRNP